MKNDNKRLFLALWPDDEVRRSIGAAAGRIARSAEGRPVAMRNLHMTLAFLHYVPVSVLPCIVNAAGRCSNGGFDMTLDRIGFWRRSRILWLGCTDTPPALIALVDRLWQALGACGFTPERRAFHPHVTLARRSAPPRRSREQPVVHWHVNGFVLVESITGGRQSRYEVLQRWPLEGAATG